MPTSRRRERGVVIPLTAALMVALITFAALAIDVGIGASRTRDLQQVADLIAVDVARLLDGSNPPAGIDAQVIASAARNDFVVSGTFPTYTGGGTRRVQLELGCWVDPAPANAAITEVFQSCAAPDAVRVQAFDTVDYVFADVVGLRSANFDRTATAALLPDVRIGIGSVGAGLQQDLDPINASAHIDAYVQALNARLKAAFDTNASLTPPPNGVGLDAAGYRGLAASDVSIDTLAANAGFASPEEMANASVSNGTLFEATARSLESEGNNVAAASVRSFASRATFDNAGTTQVGSGPLGFEQGTGTADAPGAAHGRINVMDLLIGAASVADNRSFVSFQVAPQIPGVLSVRVDNQTVEGVQWQEHARPADPLRNSVRTAQVRQQLTITVDGGVLGIPGLSSPITLPIVVEGATGDATLQRLRCTDPLTSSSAVLGAVTSLVRARVGVATNLQTAGSAALTVASGVLIESGDYSITTLLYLGISGAWALGQDITGSGSASLGGGSSTHTFLPLATPNPSQRATGGVAVNLGSSLRSNTSTGLPLIGTTNLLASLSTVFTNIGANVIDPVLRAAGITLGGADVFADTMVCDQPQLVG